uniref:Uncharacterized protein n=1 Tax=Anguilla anguilla TaxID=7936 RepID=A0A0E9Q2W6_ANGAN
MILYKSLEFLVFFFRSVFVGSGLYCALINWQNTVNFGQSKYARHQSKGDYDLMTEMKAY